MASLHPGNSLSYDHIPSVHITILVISLTILLFVLCCGPLCCIFCVALQFNSLRDRFRQQRSASFAVQWRRQNPVMALDLTAVTGVYGWEAWRFTFRPLPKEVDGLSTDYFRSQEPVTILRGENQNQDQNLEEITFNPMAGIRRMEQSIQCLLPLMHGKETWERTWPRCNYFELSIVSCRPLRTQKKSFGHFEGNVAIGLASQPAPPFRLPGMDPFSIGFHSHDGKILTGKRDEVLPSGLEWSSIGATVGCGYDADKGVVYFTQSYGTPIYTAFEIPDNVENHLFPTIGADCDVTVLVNMGQQRFKCNIVGRHDSAVNLAQIMHDENIFELGCSLQKGRTAICKN